MAPSPQGKRWCFTLNNPTPEEAQHVADTVSQLPFTYAVVGREEGANTHRPHLQGFFILNRNFRFGRLKQLLGDRFHLELARRDSFAAAEYCKKDGDYDEYGTPPQPRGQTNVLQELYTWADDFIRDNNRPPSSPEIARNHPTAYIRYPRITRCLFHRAPPPKLREGEPRTWQRELAAELNEPADDRSVLFYVDAAGGIGKTWFQQWMFTEYPEKVQILGIGKRDDLAHMIDVTKSVFFFNVPRESMEYLQYTILEQLKDGMVQSNKYASCMKIFHHNVHVVVFCNEMPDYNKLSNDRIIVRSEHNID